MLILFLNNPSPAAPQTGYLQRRCLRECRCIRIRNCQDGNDNNSVSIGLPIVTSTEARPGTSTPSKAQSYDDRETGEFDEEAERHSQAEAV
jgi:hypothetical protein